MKRKKILLAVCALVLLTAAAAFVMARKSISNSGSDGQISSFEECVAAGNPILKSYPEQCVANGRSYTNSDALPQPQ